MIANAKNGCNFLVRRDALEVCTLAPTPPIEQLELLPGQAVLRIDSFALTANNVTYAAHGETLGYWRFFPTGQDGWGLIPAWGFSTVARSEHPQLQVGQRFYGLFPLSSQLVVSPEQVREEGFRDGSAHRKPLHALYNQYTSTACDALYDRAHEAELLLLRPLFLTSLMIDDFLADHDFFGARTIIFSSASSKTAYGAALAMSLRRTVDVMGLTSPSNVSFVERLAVDGNPVYRRVLAYAELDMLPRMSSAVYVDIAGDPVLRSALHHHLGHKLKYSCLVGASHWQSGAGQPPPLSHAPDLQLPGATPTLFSGPLRIKKRTAEWGSAGFRQKLGEAWQTLLRAVSAPGSPFLRVVRGHGGGELESVYRALLQGRVRPDQGHVLSLARA
jgi:hypothetical protein